jgi:type II secretory pathway pseudopilin PulG
MGSTQMLLIVMGVIIVGIAIVVGTLPNFIKGMNNSNKDALTQDCLKLAAAAQGFYRRPTLFRGGGNSFTNIAIKDLGMTDAGGGRAENANGEFSVDGSAGTTCEITGYSSTVGGATISVIVHAGSVEDPVFDGW